MITRVGILGCGAIGMEMAMVISRGDIDGATLVSLYDQDAKKATHIQEKISDTVWYYSNFQEFLSTEGMDLVIECASPQAVRLFAPEILQARLNLLMLSSGSLADAEFFRKISKIAEENDSQLIVPSGALGGVDAIRAVRHLLKEVVLTTTKPPKGLMGAPGFKEWESVEFTGPQVIFEGNALQAIQEFPANVNVGVTLSLAGIGPERTKVKVVADPKAPGNVHEIFARGDFGAFRFRMENKPHITNPRTSYLAILSAIETLRSICGTGPRIGT